MSRGRLGKGGLNRSKKEVGRFQGQGSRKLGVRTGRNIKSLRTVAGKDGRFGKQNNIEKGTDTDMTQKRGERQVMFLVVKPQKCFRPDMND